MKKREERAGNVTYSAGQGEEGGGRRGERERGEGDETVHRAARVS